MFPATKLVANDKIVGSGPYEMSKYQDGQQLVLKPNPHYAGTLKLHNSGVIVRYYTQASALKLAIEGGDTDVAYRTFSPTDIASLRGEGSRGVQVVYGQGAEIQYFVFNQKIMPGGDGRAEARDPPGGGDTGRPPAIAKATTTTPSSRCTRWSRPA